MVIIRRVVDVLSYFIHRWMHLVIGVMGIVEWLRGETHWGVTWIILSWIMEELTDDEA